MELGKKHSGGKYHLDDDDDLVDFSDEAKPRSGMDKKQRDHIKKMERDRKVKQEKLTQELETAAEKLNEVKRKLDASKSRNAVLVNENKSLKDQMQTLLAKGKHDDELVDALMKQQERMRDMISKSSDSNVGDGRQEKVIEDLKLKRQQVQEGAVSEDLNTVEQLQSILQQKETRLTELEGRITQLLAEAERSNRSLRDQGRVSARMVCATDDQLSIAVGPKPQISPERSPRESLNASTQAVCGDTRTVRNSNQDVRGSTEMYEQKVLLDAAEKEHVQLVELTQSLNKRLEEAVAENVNLKAALHEERRQTALQKRDRRNQVAKTRRSLNVRDSIDGTEVTDEQQLSSATREELETSVVIAQDENRSLRSLLQETLKSKEHDLQTYEQMLHETKQVFVDGIRKFKLQTLQLQG